MKKVTAEVKGKSLVITLISLTALCGCSSSSGPVSDQADPCWTKGASYICDYTEGANGTCGSIPEQLFNVNQDGTIPTVNGIQCAASTVEGCTLNNTDCTTTVNGIQVTVTSHLTVASDGTSAQGTESATESAGSASCASTYSVSCTRQ